MKNGSTNIVFSKKELKINSAVRTADIISAIILLLFFYTAITKLIGNETFLFSLKRSPILSAHAGFIAIALPVAELLISILLFIPLTRLKGLFAATFALIIFTAYLVYIVLYSPNVPCSCGGVIKTLSWPQHIFFNLFFIVLSITGISLYQKVKNRRSKIPP